MVGGVPMGGDAPVTVQTMTKASAEDVEGTLAQIRRAADAGCDIIRCAVPSISQADAFAAVVAASPLPVVADVHFDWRIALAAVRAGAAKVRLNPGNMDPKGLADVAKAARERGIPIRIGMNSGSAKRGGDMAADLAEAALSWAGKLEEQGFHDIVLSLKAPDAASTVAANRLAAEKSDYPLHLGVTAAGLEEDSLLKSALALGALLMDGIGDTIRLSFTGSPESEVRAGRRLLAAAGLRKEEAELVSCPTCGRCRVDLLKLAAEVRQRLAEIPAPLRIAVMGCEVNGPGEAKDADIGIAAAGGNFMLFIGGEPVRRLSPEAAVDELMREAKRLAEHG